MKEKLYIILITLLAAACVFLVLENRSVGHPGMGKGMGMHGRGMGQGIGPGAGLGCGAALDSLGQNRRTALFSAIRNGEHDTSALFRNLDSLIQVQRETQMSALLRIIRIRDSLSGPERDAFLKKLDQRFCGRGSGMGRQ